MIESDTPMQHLAYLQQIAAAQPYPLLFATISGAHLYGFPSPDSDYDLRGVHMLPLSELVGLETGPETIEISDLAGGIELDLVTHEVKKFFSLLLKKNGYVLEQLYSPLVVASTPEHAELRAIAHGCITRHHWHHYAGFAETQWRLWLKEQPMRVKPLLYLYRVLLTGIHLMQTGEVEANLVQLNARYPQPAVPDLIARKIEGAEHTTLPAADLSTHEAAYQRLVAQLEAAGHASQLPDGPTSRAALHDLLLRLRLRRNT